MATTNNRDNLGFMGEEFQRRFVKHLIENKDFFEEIFPILDPNKFTIDVLRRIVATMLNRYKESTVPLTYFELETLLRSNITDDPTRAIAIETLNALKDVSSEGMGVTIEEGARFFKQQNLIKAVQEVNGIIKRGDPKEYDKIEGIVSDALMQNVHKEMGFHLFDSIETDLSPDYRRTITTGCRELDGALGGGIGKGELGVIIAPTNVGKSQPLDSRVLTPMGFVRMGDIKVGDLVIGGDGLPYSVMGVYPQGLREIIKITFSNGASCECDTEHLWTVWEEGKKCVITLSDIMAKITDKAELRGQGIKFPILRNLSLPKLFSDDNDELKNEFVAYVGGVKGYSVFGDSNIVHCLYSEDTVYIEHLEYMGEKEAQCIMIDSDDHTYITDDFIITHNTSICTGFAAAAALEKSEYNDYKGYKVLHFFFEDTPITVKRKYYGYFTGIDAQDLHLPGYRERALELLNSDSDARKALQNNVVCHRLRSGEETASSVVTLIKRYISLGFKPDLFILDYFECLEPEPIFGNEEKNEWKREGKTMRKFEAVCQDYNMAAWIPVQGTKDSYGAEYVGLRGASGSATKTQIGHVIISMARPEEYKGQGKINLYVNKLRGIRFSTDHFMGVYFNNGTCRLDMSQSMQVDIPVHEDNSILEERGPAPF